jgi:hypothetical protein
MAQKVANINIALQMLHADGCPITASVQCTFPHLSGRFEVGAFAIEEGEKRRGEGTPIVV